MDVPERISSRDNRRLVALRKVRDGKDGSAIFIEGVRLCNEALRSDLVIEDRFIAESFADTAGVGRGATVVADRIFRSVSDTPAPQGLILTARRPVSSLHDLAQRLSATAPVVVFLSEINNPSNLGAVVRAAEAAGAPGIITSPNSADPYSPKALRASMGSAFRMPVVEGVHLNEACHWATGQGMTTLALDVRGNKSYTDVDWRRPSMVIFGSEAHGLSSDELGRVDQSIVIPMEREVESLNLSVAAGVVLFEARRHRPSNEAR